MVAIVSAASGRSVSSRTTRASGASRGGGAALGSAGSASPDSPKATTRRPAAVSSSSLLASPAGRGSALLCARTSGAPRTYEGEDPPTVNPLHFHSQENG